MFDKDGWILVSYPPGTEKAQSVYAASRDASEATGVGTVLAIQNPGE
jgi:hypothetical protein